MKSIPRTSRILFFAGLALPLLALLLIGWLVNETSTQYKDSFFQVSRTYKVLNAVEQTQMHLLDAETGRRGYLLAGGKDYLDSYAQAMTAIQKDIEALQTLSSFGGGQRTNILELQNLVSVRLGIAPDRLAQDRTNLPDLLAISLTAQGKETMDRINRVLFQMREEEEYTLNLRQQRTEAAALSSQIGTVILIATVAVALLFIIFIFVRLEKLQQVVTICAWSGQVKYEGGWIRLDEYLQRRFGLSITHGLSKEAAAKMAAEIESLNRPGQP
jgi:CHASE3 domain sensor protein